MPRLLRHLGLMTLLVLTGCAGARRATDRLPDRPAAFPRHTVDQILAEVHPLPDSIKAFRARANFALNSPWQSGRFSGDVVHRRGDSLYVSLSPGMGIEAARVLVTPDSFYLYNRIDREVIVGSMDQARTVLPPPFSADDLFRTLLGLPAPEPDVAWQVEADSSYYYLKSPDERRIYTVDPGLWRVIRYEERAPDGSLVEDRVYLDWDGFDGLYLPRRMIFRRPKDRTTATIYYRSVTLNPTGLSFSLRMNGQTTRIPAERILDAFDE
ncbi:MAG: DUF4292 domain-containing protein [Bacteroidetes bacterium]|nr:MAG: DUF4292 domain-containing protein [Bacteroidota bacterium]